MSDNYLLSNSATELDRLSLQARVWQPAAEQMLDRINIKPGWQCLDLGCGAVGILQPLSKRVGDKGRVFGIDSNQEQLVAARNFVQQQELVNVQILERDAYNTELPDQEFDLTHVRFVFAPVGRDNQLLQEMLRLTKPNGVIAIQEPNATSWDYFPTNAAWQELKRVILQAFSLGGGDFNVGQRTYQMLQQAGVRDIQINAAVIALHKQHPYMRLPLQFVTSLRQKILTWELISEAELDKTIAEFESYLANADPYSITMTVTQVWGIK